MREWRQNNPLNWTPGEAAAWVHLGVCPADLLRVCLSQCCGSFASMQRQDSMRVLKLMAVACIGLVEGKCGRASGTARSMRDLLEAGASATLVGGSRDMSSGSSKRVTRLQRAALFLRDWSALDDKSARTRADLLGLSISGMLAVARHHVLRNYTDERVEREGADPSQYNPVDPRDIEHAGHVARGRAVRALFESRNQMPPGWLPSKRLGASTLRLRS